MRTGRCRRCRQTKDVNQTNLIYYTDLITRTA